MANTNMQPNTPLPYEPRFDDHISGKIDPLLKSPGTPRSAGLPERRVEALARLRSGEQPNKRTPSMAARIAIASSLTLGGAAATDGFKDVPVAEQTVDVVEKVADVAAATAGNMISGADGSNVGNHFDTVNQPPGGEPLEYRGGVAYEPGTNNTVVVPEVQSQP